jgi:hypothetical protein
MSYWDTLGSLHSTLALIELVAKWVKATSESNHNGRNISAFDRN